MNDFHVAAEKYDNSVKIVKKLDELAPKTFTRGNSSSEMEGSPYSVTSASSASPFGIGVKQTKTDRNRAKRLAKSTEPHVRTPMNPIDSTPVVVAIDRVLGKSSPVNEQEQHDHEPERNKQ